MNRAEIVRHLKDREAGHGKDIGPPTLEMARWSLRELHIEHAHAHGLNYETLIEAGYMDPHEYEARSAEAIAEWKSTEFHDEVWATDTHYETATSE